MKLDIGCGNGKPEGFVGIDIRPTPAADIVNYPRMNAGVVDRCRCYDLVVELPERPQSDLSEEIA